jgi:hypothetical protein
MCNRTCVASIDSQQQLADIGGGLVTASGRISGLDWQAFDRRRDCRRWQRRSVAIQHLGQTGACETRSASGLPAYRVSGTSGMGRVRNPLIVTPPCECCRNETEHELTHNHLR